MIFDRNKIKTFNDFKNALIEFGTNHNFIINYTAKKSNKKVTIRYDYTPNYNDNNYNYDLRIHISYNIYPNHFNDFINHNEIDIMEDKVHQTSESFIRNENGCTISTGISELYDYSLNDIDACVYDIMDIIETGKESI